MEGVAGTLQRLERRIDDVCKAKMDRTECEARHEVESLRREVSNPGIVVEEVLERRKERQRKSIMYWVSFIIGVSAIAGGAYSLLARVQQLTTSVAEQKKELIQMVKEAKK